MRAVLKNEFSSLFRRLYAYVYVAAMLILTAVFFTMYNLTYAAENILTVFSALPLISAILIPLVAVSVFPNKRKGNTDMLYEALPLSASDIVLGKYFAAMSVIMLPNILIAMLPALAGIFGAVDHKVSYSALVGFIFFEAALTAIITFIASRTKSSLRAYAWSYAVIAVIYFAPPLCSLMPNRSVLIYIKDIVDSVSIFSHFNIFVNGIFNIGGLLFFLGVCISFLFLTWREYAKKYEKAEKYRAFNFKSAVSLLSAIAVVAVSLVLPLSAQMLPDRYMEFDATGAKKNSVSKAAEKYLASVDEQVTIYLLESTGAHDYELYLEGLAATSKSISIEKIYYESTPNFYSDRGITVDASTVSQLANSLIVQSADRWTPVNYTELFYYSNSSLGVGEMTVSDYQYYLSMFSQSEQYADYLQSLLYESVLYFDANEIIAKSIEYVLTDIIPTEYYLTGHGESDFGLEQSLDISNSSVPADAASILINKPTTDITSDEAQRLIEYLGRGGQLTFITNEANLDMANLCSVLAAYGMSAQKGSVKQSTIDAETEETVSSAKFSAALSTDNDVLYYMETLGMAALDVNNANAIHIDTAKESELKLTVIPLLTTDKTAFIGEDSTAVATYKVACAVEAPNGAKLAWFTGDGYSNGTTKTDMAVICAMSWVSLEYESHIDGITAVQYTQPLTPITTGTVKVMAFVMITFPVVLCVFGVIKFYKRKKA